MAGLYKDQIHRNRVSCNDSRTVEFDAVRNYVAQKIQDEPGVLKRLVTDLLVDENAEEIRRELEADSQNTMPGFDLTKLDKLFTDKDRKNAEKDVDSFIKVLRNAWKTKEDAYRVTAIYLDTGIRLLNRSKNGKIQNLDSNIVSTVEKVISILPEELIGVFNSKNSLILAPSPSNSWVRIGAAVTSSLKDTIYMDPESFKRIQSEMKNKDVKVDYAFRTIIHELGHLLDAKWTLVNLDSDSATDPVKPGIEIWDDVPGRKRLKNSLSYTSTRPDQSLPAWPGVDQPYRNNAAEIFAEYFSFYMTAPNLIKDKAAPTYNFFNQVVFKGEEFQDVECL
jgi:hypothetical protein